MGLEGDTVTFDLNPGQPVKIIDGPFEGSIGTVEEVINQKRTVKIKLSVFGRDTFVELDFHMLQRI
jgi:transcriptional antiterminator NusG